MKIFISWSGAMSRNVASVLHDWLPHVLPEVKPFVSADIGKGEHWSAALAQELEDTDFGIICVTPANLDSPWLNFEAGSLSKSVDHSYVVPFLFHVEPTAVKFPLAQFQAVVFGKEEVFRLLVDINKRLGHRVQQEQKHLEEIFERHWESLRDKMLRIGEGCEREPRQGWLLTPNDIEEIAANCDCRSIWVVSPSPHEDLEITRVRGLVQKNIEHGVRYTLLVPSDTVEAAHEILQQIFGARLHQLRIKGIPRRPFESLAVTHYLLVNPEQGDPGLRVFLELPTVQRDNWIEVNSDAAADFAVRFRKMLIYRARKTRKREPVLVALAPRDEAALSGGAS